MLADPVDASAAPYHEQVLAYLGNSDAVVPRPLPDVHPVRTAYNPEAIIPPQCYTRTEGRFNPRDTHLYPTDTEFLHTVRYLGIAEDGEIGSSRRMKEVRYMRKWVAYRKHTHIDNETAPTLPGEFVYDWDIRLDWSGTASDTGR